MRRKRSSANISSMSNTTSETTAAAERPAQERKEPTYLFTEKYVADKSEIARRFIETRAQLIVIPHLRRAYELLEEMYG
jgi:hypothetical protein